MPSGTAKEPVSSDSSICHVINDEAESQPLIRMSTSVDHGVRQNSYIVKSHDGSVAETTERVETQQNETQGAGQRLIVSLEDNKQILRKIDLAILPIIMVIYCLQSLDKTALSYASVFDLIDSTHLVGNQYSWLGSIVYVAQLIWQPIVAYLLVKLPVGKFCSIMVLCWGITLCCMSAATNFGGLMAARFVLGSFEASVAPTFIAIVQMWYRRAEQTNRNAAWYSMLGVVNIFGSLLTFGLGHIQSTSLHSYQIIFLFCGLLTVCFSVVVYLFLPDSPANARFLTSKDKLMAIERVRMNQMGASSGAWNWYHVRECLLDVKTWLWFFMLGAVSIPSGGITTFGPLIIKSFNFTAFQTILFNMPFGAVQLLATLGSAFVSTYFRVKSPILAFLCLPPIIGISILVNVEYSSNNRGVLLFAYYLTSVYPAISPMIYSWSGQNTGGDTKRKVTTAVLFIGASAGNIIGPLLYTTAEAPRYYRGLRSNLALFATIIVLVGLSTAYLQLLNKRHELARERSGKKAKILDLSMAQKKHLIENAAAVNNIDAAAVNDIDAGDGAGDQTFHDITDLRNEDFVYVY